MRERDKDGLLQSNGNTICVLDRMRESAPPRPKLVMDVLAPAETTSCVLLSAAFQAPIEPVAWPIIPVQDRQEREGGARRSIAKCTDSRWPASGAIIPTPAPRATLLHRQELRAALFTIQRMGTHFRDPRVLQSGGAHAGRDDAPLEPRGVRAVMPRRECGARLGRGSARTMC